MIRAVATVGILLLGAGAGTVHADEITAYGVGLKSCRAYLEARERGTPADQVVFVDWLSGYISGVNQTSRHRNNFLGLRDLGEAMQRIDEYCHARPVAPLAEGAGTLVLAAGTGPSAHAMEATTYGSADKSCMKYLEVRGEQDPVNGAEFRDWLAGYLTGVNTISMKTNNVLGSTELLDAIRWIDNWCHANPLASLGGAADALVIAHQPDKTAETGRIQLSSR
jgi:hypothetical protein